MNTMLMLWAATATLTDCTPIDRSTKELNPQAQAVACVLDECQADLYAADVDMRGLKIQAAKTEWELRKQIYDTHVRLTGAIEENDRLRAHLERQRTGRGWGHGAAGAVGGGVMLTAVGLGRSRPELMAAGAILTAVGSLVGVFTW